MQDAMGYIGIENFYIVVVLLLYRLIPLVHQVLHS